MTGGKKFTTFIVILFAFLKPEPMKHHFTLLFTLCISICLTGQSLQPDMTVATDETFKLSDFRLKVYPNPATDFIRVEWETTDPSEFIVELYDLVGRRIIRKKSEYPENSVQIQMQSLKRSAYLLKVYTSDSKYSRTLRIVKY